MTAFDAASVESALRQRSIDLKVVFFDTVGSTNEEAKRASRDGSASTGLFVADAQTHGRGRATNSWHSPPGDNLYFSLLLRPKLRTHDASKLTLSVGVAILEVVSRLALRPDALRIKWPNDILHEDRKLGGILTESQIRGGEVTSVVIGVGVNVNTRSFPEELEATSVAHVSGIDANRAALLGDLVAEILAATLRFERDGIAASLPRLRAADALFGIEVRIGETRGRARGIDDEGRLLVDAGGEIIAVSSGHVERT